MTEVQLATEFAACHQVTHVELGRIAERNRLGRQPLTWLRSNMKHSGLLSGDYKPTQELAYWIKAHQGEDITITKGSFAPLDVECEDDKTVIKQAPEKTPPKPRNNGKSQCAVPRDRFLAEVKRLGDAPGRTQTLAGIFNVSTVTVHSYLKKYGVPLRTGFGRNTPQPAAPEKITEEEHPMPNETVAQIVKIFDPELAHAALCADIHDTWTRKNRDYGDSFHLSCDELGLIAGVVRMSDKWLRIKSLTRQQACVADESLRDTLLDLANYSLMTVMELDRGVTK